LLPSGRSGIRTARAPWRPTPQDLINEGPMTKLRIKGRAGNSASPVFAFILFLVSVTIAGAQGPAPGSIRKQIGTPTRQVALFTDLETQLSAGSAHQDRATLDRLLADDFQLWTADHPSDPVGRDQWMEQALSSSSPAGVVHEMNVHMEGEVAIVSFLLTPQPSASATSHDLFLVDVWTKQVNTWQLATRYACHTPFQISPKPSGKE
jgi:Domain of unknown function (DUF4440)